MKMLLLTASVPERFTVLPPPAEAMNDVSQRSKRSNVPSGWV